MSVNFFDLPIYVVLAFTFLLMNFFSWLGYRYKKNRIKKYPDEVQQKGRLQSTALGVLSLLMGFTFSVAMSKFEAQRRVLAQEAGYINTAILRCDMYPDSTRNLLLADFNEYIEARSSYYKEHDIDKSNQALKRAELISKRIWKRVTPESQNNANASRTGQMIPALNNMIDIVIARDAEKSSKVPLLVLWVLLILMLLDAFILGTELTDRRKSKIFIWANAIVMSLTFNLIIELHQPRSGLINLDATEQKIENLRELVK